MQGTGPFMSVSVLYGAAAGDVKHRPCHDLESIFYVLLYVCTFFKAASKTKARNTSSAPMKSWFDGHIGFRLIADLKSGQIHQFNTRLSNSVTPEFQDLITYLSAMFECLFPQGDWGRDLMASTATHVQMKQALQKVYGLLSDQDLLKP